MPPFRYLHLCLAVLLILPGGLTYAQSESVDELALLYGDEEMVSIATGAEKPLRLAPSVATVITDEEIRAMGARNLGDVLKAVPGLHVSLGLRYSELYSIRGIHTSLNPHVLVLINGYPITDLYTGGRIPKFNMPVHNIKRVEVVRGPVSALFGADAFSGAINIITYAAGDIDNSMGITLGSFNTRGIWIKGATQIGGWNLGLSLEWEKSDGDSGRRIDTDLQTLLDAALSTNASLAPGSANTQYDVINSQLQLSNSNWAITLSSWETNDTGIGVGVANAIDPTANQESSQFLFDVDYMSSVGDWELETGLNYFYAKQRSYYTLLPPGVVLPIGSDGNLDFLSPVGLVSFPDGLIGSPGGEDRSIAAELVGSYTGFDNHRIRLSTGYKHQKMETTESKNFGPGVIDGTETSVNVSLTDVTGTSFVFAPNKTREVYYLSMQDEWSLYRDWELTAGVRFDDYSDFGNTVNLRAALVWQTNYNLTTKLLYGSAFRAPSFSELFAINNPITLGNPDLDPEKVKTWELSFDYRPTYTLDLQFSLYRYDAKDLIEFVPDGGNSSTAQNALDLNGYGVELETEWELSDTLSLKGSYSWQHAENTNTNNEVADAPQQLFKFDLRWSLNRTWYFSTQLYHVAERSRLTTDPRTDIDDYTLINANLYSKQWHPSYDISFSIKNIFDEDAYEPGAPTALIDHPLEGRSFYLTLDYRPSK